MNPLAKVNKLQLAILGLIMLAAGLYAAIAFGISPLLAKKKAAQELIKECEDKINTAQEALRKASGAAEKTEEIKDALREFDETYILKAEFGNYLLRAQTYVEQAASAAGLKMETISEVGLRQMTPGKSLALSAYVVSVTGLGSYQDLINLIEKLYAANPYVCVSSIRIVGTDNPRQHSFGFSVYLPCWASTKTIGALAPKEGVKRKGADENERGGE